MARAAQCSFLACLFLLAGCPETGWWCQPADDAESQDTRRRKCYRKKEYCSGTCAEHEMAYCYEVGQSVRVGAFTAPPDRYCYATPDMCAQAQRLAADVSAPCSPSDG